MNHQQEVKVTKSKVSAKVPIDLAGIKGGLKYHLINMEASDEENGLLTVYCFNSKRFVLFSQVTQNDVPAIPVGVDDVEASLFQTLNPELFAALAKVDKIKALNRHARLINVNTTSSNDPGGFCFYTLKMLFEMTGFI